MITTNIAVIKAAAYVAIILGLSGATVSAHASTPSINFLSVEYKPMDQRLPAAKAFLAAHAAPGDDVQAAETAIRRAGADCRPEHGNGTEIQCSLTADIRKTGDHLDEVTWRIQIDQTPDGKIATQARRTTFSGFEDCSRWRPTSRLDSIDAPVQSRRAGSLPGLTRQEPTTSSMCEAFIEPSQ